MPVTARVVGDVLVAALGARRHVPAERGGPARLDRGHHPQLRQVQMPGVLMAIGRTMGAEDIRDFQLWTSQSRGLPGPGLPSYQQIKRAGDVPDRLGRHLRIDRRGLQLGVAKQHLDHPDVGPALEQMGGKAVPQRVG